MPRKIPSKRFRAFGLAYTATFAIIMAVLGEFTVAYISFAGVVVCAWSFTDQYIKLCKRGGYEE